MIEVFDERRVHTDIQTPIYIFFFPDILHLHPLTLHLFHTSLFINLYLYWKAC